MADLIRSEKFIKTILYSFIYTLGLQLFIQTSNLLTTGVAGITQIINFTLLPNVSFGIIYLALNLPLLIIAYLKVGKKFTFYTLVSVFTVSIFSDIIPAVTISSDIFLNSIFGGLIMGYGMGGLLKIGSSSGGTDILGIMYYDKTGVDFKTFNLSINMIIIALGAFAFAYQASVEAALEIGLYTFVSLYFRNQGIGSIFTNNEKLTVWIVGSDLSMVSMYINNRLHHGTTIIPYAKGGYSGEEKEMIMTILNKYEYRILVNDVYNISPDVFINVTETFKVEGNYKNIKARNE